MTAIVFGLIGFSVGMFRLELMEMDASAVSKGVHRLSPDLFGDHS